MSNKLHQIDPTLEQEAKNLKHFKYAVNNKPEKGLDVLSATTSPMRIELGQ